MAKCKVHNYEPFKGEPKEDCKRCRRLWGDWQEKERRRSEKKKAKLRSGRTVRRAKKRKQSARKIRVTLLDRLAAKVAKTRDNYTCLRCGRAYPDGGRGIQAAHIFGRARPTTRHDLTNLVTFCTGCHMNFAHGNPLAFHEWARERLGEEAYEALRQRSNSIEKVDREAVRQFLEEELSRLERQRVLELENGSV